MEDRDEVVELAATQRIVHEVGARARPYDHVLAPKIRRHVRALEHPAIGDVAGDAGRPVADDLLANARPHAVGVDQRATFGALARLQRDGALLPVLRDTVYALTA